MGDIVDMLAKLHLSGGVLVVKDGIKFIGTQAERRWKVAVQKRLMFDLQEKPASGFIDGSHLCHCALTSIGGAILHLRSSGAGYPNVIQVLKGLEYRRNGTHRLIWEGFDDFFLEEKRFPTKGIWQSDYGVSDIGRFIFLVTLRIWTPRDWNNVDPGAADPEVVNRTNALRSQSQRVIESLPPSLLHLS